MNREEAIAIIRKEYLCVDRDCDIERSCGKCDLMIPSKEPILEAYKVAIKALEQESVLDKIRDEVEQLRLHKAQFLTSDCKVCIDSQAVLDIIDKYKVESEV